MMRSVETGQIVVLHVRHAFWQTSLTYFAKQQRENKKQIRGFDLAVSIFQLFKVQTKQNKF